MALGVPLALPTIAAHTPPGHFVKVIDEEIEDIDFEEHFDLVGITAMTFKAKRAYEIAAEYKRRGIPVVMGGIHASMAPEEVTVHVDSTVIGEAEELWPEIINDAEQGRLKKIYKAEKFPDLTTSGIPRYDLIKNRQYLYTYLQTTRGCPHACNFCTVTKTNGRIVRKKTPEQVIAEVDYVLNLSPSPEIWIYDRPSGSNKKFVGTIAFIDDNFAIDRNHALAVCKVLKEYQDRKNIVFAWYTQVNYTVGFDEELLAAMEDSNCMHLFIGFENLDPDTLKTMKKKMNNPEKFSESIENIHKHSMKVVFSTIIGDDNTSLKNADILKEFIEKNRVFHVLLNILTPYPGTELAEVMGKEGRILTTEPQLYNIRNVVFQPKKVSVEELIDIYRSLCTKLYEYDSLIMRGRALLPHMDRIYLAQRWKMLIGMYFMVLLFALKRRLRWAVALKMLAQAPGLILGNGSLSAYEILASSADYDDFGRSEAERMSVPISIEGGTTGRVIGLIEQGLKAFTLPQSRSSFRFSYVSEQQLSQRGIKVEDEDKERPILVLGGTSIPISDRLEFIEFLMESGYEVATIENPIGGPWDIFINPARERPASLKETLNYMKDSLQLKQVDIVAQSYSTFEVIRTLLKDKTYNGFVKNIIFINPPGFNENITFVGHCLGFIKDHLAKGYLKSMGAYFGFRTLPMRSSTKKEREYAKREIKGISQWGFKTTQNLVRTFREVIDIVSFKIKEPLIELREDGYNINFFLQSEDQVVPIQPSVKTANQIFSKSCVKVVPGGHNDLFFQKWQRHAFLNFLKEIRSESLQDKQKASL